MIEAFVSGVIGAILVMTCAFLLAELQAVQKRKNDVVNLALKQLEEIDRRLAVIERMMNQ